MVTKIKLYEKKKDKIKSNKIIDLDLLDLEKYSNLKTPENFFDIASHKIDNKSILEWFAINDISYWWFFAPILSPKYNEASSFIDQLKGVIKNYNPKEIELHGLYDKKDLAKQVCNNFDVKLNYSVIKFVKSQINVTIKSILRKPVYTKLTKTKIKKRLKCLQNKNFSIPKNKFIVFTSHQGYRRDQLDLKSGKSQKSEHVIQPILDLCVDENIPILCIDFDYTLKGRTDILNERLSSKYNWIPVEYFLKNKKTSHTNKQISQLNSSIRHLIKKDLSTMLKYDDVSLWNYLKPKFQEFLLEPHLPTYLHLISQFEDFLAKNRPESILQLYEVGPFAKSLGVAAKKLEIKTIGIQHGTMIGVGTDYMHKEISNDDCPLGNLIPNQTWVYGEYHKKLLTEEGNYPVENITVTGNPSYGNILSLSSYFNREKIRNDYHFDDKKVILFPLSYRFGFKNFRNRDIVLLNFLYENFQNNKKITVLVRPHPGDNFDQKKLSQKFPSPNFICSYKSLFEDFSCSDVVVLTRSSVGVEAPLFEKPVIFVQLSSIDVEELKFFSYVRDLMKDSDVARFVNLETLVVEIDKIEKGELWKINNSEKRKYFLNHFFNFGESPNLLDLIQK